MQRSRCDEKLLCRNGEWYEKKQN